MIVAVGIDIASIDRIKRALEHPRFATRFFTDEERELCLTPAQFAGRWAAKEAIAKAVSPRTFGWKDVSVGKDAQGKPIVRAPLEKDEALHVSISHERGTAVAVAILERRANNR